jgi:two-component system cell cycle response regulator
MPAKILVIEDNAANLDLMVYLLGAFGHATYAAHDGEEGLAKAASEKPDLIVCDVQLPKLDGYGVVRHLKADPAFRGIPVIAVTALAMVGDRDRVLKAGFDGYLAKPIDPETFVQQIERYLGTASSVALGSTETVAVTPRQPRRQATVLAVDNVPANLELVCSLLEPFGYRVITASGGREALATAGRERPDLILSDVCMADGTGYEFIQSVKADPQLSSIPFVFITSSMMEDHDRSKGLALGAERFLLRPLDPEILLAEIAACLAEKGRVG